MALFIEALVGIPAIDEERWHEVNGFTKWLIASRASVLPMTLFAFTFAVCMAQPDSSEKWWLAGITGLALILAHATNNLINDYVDYTTGVDKDNYFRVQYGVHILEAGLVSQRQFLRYVLVTGSLALVLAILVSWYAGGLVPWIAGSGAFFVLFYTYPLKRIALGEIAVFLVWGPLMVVGTYLVIVAEFNAAVIWAGVVYGLGPAVVIFAKHTDKAPHDRAKKILTLPVLLGNRARQVVAGILVAQMVLAVLLGVHFGMYGMGGIVLAVPAAFRCLKVLQELPPASRPADYPTQAWPLWYTTFAFRYARDAGLGLTLGVLLQNSLF